MQFAITLVTAFSALYLVQNVKKKMTKAAVVLLVISSLIEYDPYFGIGRYGIYFIIFFSFFAAIESLNSMRMTRVHNAFFLGSAIVIALFELLILIGFPFDIPKYPFAFFYLIGFSLCYMLSRRKIFTRLGVLVVWLGVALKWLLPHLT